MENIRQKIAEIITHTHKTPLEQADEILLLFSVSGRSEQFKCSCGSTDFDKNNYHDSIRCNGCGSVYTNI